MHIDRNHTFTGTLDLNFNVFALFSTNALDNLIEEDPDSMRARKMRAEVYAKTGQTEKALAECLEISGKFDQPVTLGVLQFFIFVSGHTVEF